MVRRKVPRAEILNKLNIGRSTVNDIWKCEDNLKSIQMAKYEMGISKFTNITKSCEKGMFDKLYE